MATKLDTLVVDVLFKGDSKALRSFERDFDRVARNVGRISGRVALAGAGMIAGALGAVSQFSKYEEQINRMRALVGLNEQELVQAEEGIRAAAKATGKSLQDMAEAMYFVTSAGYRGAEASELLLKAAQASEVGLGETTELAAFASSAMNQFGITAEQAFDSIAVTVRAGIGETDSFARAILQLIPAAKLAGISFEEIGGTLSAFSQLTGGEIDEVKTQFRRLLLTLAAPTKQTVKGLDAIGLSVERVKEMMRTEGPVEALVKIKDLIDSTAGVTLNDVLPDSSAKIALEQITGNIELFRKHLSFAANTAGASEKAFKDTEGTFKDLSRALSELKNIMLDWGRALAPVVSQWLREFAMPLATWVREMIARFPGLIAAGFKLVGLLTTLATGLWAASKAALAVKAALTFIGVMTPIGAITAAVAALAAAVMLVATNWDVVRQELAAVMPGWLRRMLGLDAPIQLEIEAQLETVGDEIARLQAAIDSGTRSSEQVASMQARIAELMAMEMALEERKWHNEQAMAANAEGIEKTEAVLEDQAAKLADLQLDLAHSTGEEREQVAEEIKLFRDAIASQVDKLAFMLTGSAQSYEAQRFKESRLARLGLLEDSGRFSPVQQRREHQAEKLEGTLQRAFSWIATLGQSEETLRRKGGDQVSLPQPPPLTPAIVGPVPTLATRERRFAAQNQTTIVRQSNTINLEGVGLSEEAATNLVASKMAEQTHAAVESATGN